MYLSSGGVFLIFVVVGIFIRLFGQIVEKSVAFGVSYRAENVFFDFFVVLFQSFQKIFNILSFGVLVGRAGVVNDGFILCERRDFFFADVNHRADNRKPLSVEFRHGGESGKPALVKQR